MSKQTALSILLSSLWLVGTGAEATNSLHITQEGNSHRATIEQATVDPAADGNQAFIDQVGSGQWGYILQDSGSNNFASIAQEGYGTLNEANRATIAQSGNGGTATIVQDSGDINTSQAEIQQRSGALSSGAHIVQVGQWSTARIEQDDGEGNTATIHQGKKGNDSRKNPTPDVPCDKCDATILQTGSFNTATIVQRGQDGFEGYDLLAQITQTGTWNTATIEQYGFSNTASILQDGNDNNGSITQYGDDNDFTLKQYGDGHSFSIVQAGGAHGQMTQGTPP